MGSSVGCLCYSLYPSYLHCRSGYPDEQYLIYFETCSQMSWDVHT